MSTALIRLAIQVVQNVTSQLNNLFNFVESAVLSPTRTDAQTVAGGEVWRGLGADAFVDELSSIMIPNVGTIGEFIQTKNTNIQIATEIITAADMQVNQIVAGLADEFASVY